ncbi:MAG TPA: BON domain-containing protein [Verrucomicrobiae bacterium]|nr:BON domain-containing protein [Verrucomicrobiae bacterium]
MKSRKLVWALPAVIAAGCAHPEHERTALLTDPIAPVYVSQAAPTPSHSPAATIPSEPGAAAPTAVIHSSDVFSTHEADNTLVSQVRNALMADASLTEGAPAISIAAAKGIVVLTGTARTDAQKQQAEALARQVAGVVEVRNELQVAAIATASPSSNTSATQRADGDQVSDVQQRGGVSGSALKSGNEPALSATSRDGANSSLHQGSEGSAAGGAAGAVNVQVLGSSVADAALAQQISQELKKDASLGAALSHVNVTVNDGRVVLKGDVRNEVQRREIENTVQRVTGAATIDNQLRIAADADSLPYNP